MRIGEGGAVELEEIPVCEGCDDGLLDGGEDRDQVGLGLGRENVDRRDGGLGRARWERLMGCEDGSLSNLELSGAVQAQVVAEGWPASKSDLGTIVSQVAHRSLATNGVEESPSRTISANGEPESSASPSPVYITITDPINGPSFKRSPTKPIPRWMRQLPNGREREQVEEHERGLQESKTGNIALERMGGRLIDCFSRLDSRIDSLIHSLEITGAH